MSWIKTAYLANTSALCNDINRQTLCLQSNIMLCKDAFQTLKYKAGKVSNRERLLHIQPSDVTACVFTLPYPYWRSYHSCRGLQPRSPTWKVAVLPLHYPVTHNITNVQLWDILPFFLYKPLEDFNTFENKHYTWNLIPGQKAAAQGGY